MSELKSFACVWFAKEAHQLTPVRLASGLYYLSEIVEEHTVLAKRFLLRVIYFVIGLLFLAWAVDRLPFGLTLLSIFSHVIYLGNMRRFPFVQLTDPLFIASCCMSSIFTNRLIEADHAN